MACVCVVGTLTSCFRRTVKDDKIQRASGTFNGVVGV